MIVRKECYQVRVGLEDQMYKVIDYKKVDISDIEFDHYKQLVKSFSNDGINGSIYFKDLFEVDDNGLIILIKTLTYFKFYSFLNLFILV